ncbi:recombinase family protein [Phenylobacterium sp.]|jgi:DNA invertase Pin-like site-specific DNA recombinase|uniref:recombinase family protein n=1 Tax=Phenylobacterium sp. TaxID=1871053 RepID=UPI002F935859
MSSTIPVAQYLRMSTEHQNYSLEMQARAIGGYAADHGYRIVRTYRDAGVSGVRLDGREALQALLADVLSGRADFKVVLVYDVSRWGRFQDPDQGAHYEFVCRDAGVRIEYCAEPFQNDDALASTLVKHLKRAMAAEYSRELSAKVSAAMRGLAAKGFRPAGDAPCPAPGGGLPGWRAAHRASGGRAQGHPGRPHHPRPGSGG